MSLITIVSLLTGIMGIVSLCGYVILEIYASIRKRMNRDIGSEIAKILSTSDSVIRDNLLNEIKSIAENPAEVSLRKKSELARNIVFLSLFNAIDYSISEEFGHQLKNMVRGYAISHADENRKSFRELTKTLPPLIDESIQKLMKDLTDNVGGVRMKSLVLARRRRVISHSAEIILKKIDSAAKEL